MVFAGLYSIPVSGRGLKWFFDRRDSFCHHHSGAGSRSLSQVIFISGSLSHPIGLRSLHPAVLVDQQLPAAILPHARESPLDGKRRISPSMFGGGQHRDFY